MAAPSASPTLRTRSRQHGPLLLLGLLALLTVAAWALTIHQARTMDMPMGIVARAALETAPAEDDSMPGMDMGNSTMSGIETAAASGMAGMVDGRTWDGMATFVIAWTVMMTAMMFPAAAPMLLFFQRFAAQQRGTGGAFVPTWVFAAGYLLVWTVAGVATWLLVQLGSDLAGRIGSAGRETWAPLALGATLAIAGLYQCSSLKGICLRQCQSPLGFVMTNWRTGYRGALRMGIIHGAFCLGCCWALFAVLVAAGVMSLAWMLLLTLMIFAEKALPLSPRTPQAIGAVFLLLAGLVAAGAADLPWVA